eukprot:UN20306
MGRYGHECLSAFSPRSTMMTMHNNLLFGQFKGGGVRFKLTKYKVTRSTGGDSVEESTKKLFTYYQFSTEVL